MSFEPIFRYSAYFDTAGNETETANRFNNCSAIWHHLNGRSILQEAECVERCRFGKNAWRKAQASDQHTPVFIGCSDPSHKILMH